MSQEHESKTVRSVRIYTRCPACHNDTLTVNDDKHLLCTWLTCTDPTLVDRIESELSTLREELQRVKARVAAINGQRNVMANAVNQQNWEMFWNADKLLGELVAGNCDHQLAQDFASLRAQLAAREAGLTELGNELFDCKAQLKDADDRLAAREEELRQAREKLAALTGWIDKNIIFDSEEDRAEFMSEGFKWIDEFRKWAWAESDSLRAALVEAQEIGARKDEALNYVLNMDLVPFESEEEADSGTRRVLSDQITEIAKLATAALALTQTPNLYREQEEK